MKLINLLSIFSLFVSFFGTSLMAMDMPMNLQARIEAIKKHYQLSPNRCRSSWNKDVSFAKDHDVLLACLIAGYKDVYLTTVPEFHKIIPGLKSLLPELNIKQFSLNDDMILFTPKGTRSGLLLAKLHLLAAIKASSFPLESNEETMRHIIPANELPPEYNTYLMGVLLGYPDTDIKYYYIVNDFKDLYEDTSQLNPTEFPLWPEADKKIFNYYEENIWPQSEDYQNYLIDKNIAEKWFIQNNQQSVAELEQEIRNLQQQLFNLTKDNTSRWIIRED